MGDQGQLSPLSDGDPPGDHLVTLRTCETAFEAHALAAVLHDADIEAWVFDSVTCVAITGMTVGVPLQVRAKDVALAEETLDRRIADSVDIDWDEVDVGDTEDGPGAASFSFGRHAWLLPLLFVICVLMALMVFMRR
jgi:hypothetical protein